MPQRLTPQEIHEQSLEFGSYQAARFDREETIKILRMCKEDYEFGQSVKKLPTVNYRILFNIHYDIIRELCALLMKSKNLRISSHQGLFAYIILNFPNLEFDWDFLESLRDTRNQNKYQGSDIPEETWKKAELRIDLYISALKENIERRIGL